MGMEHLIERLRQWGKQLDEKQQAELSCIVDGTLSDDELDHVAGGAKKATPDEVTKACAKLAELQKPGPYPKP